MSIQYAALELAGNGRARCGHCKGVIAAGEVRLRLGWESGFRYFHAACGAQRESHHVQAALRTWIAPSGFDVGALAAAAAASFHAGAAIGLARLEAEIAVEQQSAGGASPRLETLAAPAGTRCGQCRRTFAPGLHVVDRAARVHLVCMGAWAERRGSPERWERSLAENSSPEDLAAMHERNSR